MVPGAADGVGVGGVVGGWVMFHFFISVFDNFIPPRVSHRLPCTEDDRKQVNNQPTARSNQPLHFCSRHVLFTYNRYTDCTRII